MILERQKRAVLINWLWPYCSSKILFNRLSRFSLQAYSMIWPSSETKRQLNKLSAAEMWLSSELDSSSTLSFIASFVAINGMSHSNSSARCLRALIEKITLCLKSLVSPMWANCIMRCLNYTFISRFLENLVNLVTIQLTYSNTVLGSSVMMWPSIYWKMARKLTLSKI